LPDIKDAITCIENKVVDLAKIATHIMGLNDVCQSILKLPELPGGKKIVYSQKSYPITDVQQFPAGEMEGKLAEIVKKHNGLWSAESERYFLEHCPEI
jgi:hypothetical protein